MKKYFVVGLVALFALSMVSVSVAKEECSASQGAGNSLTGFLKKTFNYPVKAAQGTAEMTGNTLKNTGEKIVSKTGENTAAIVSGDLAKTGNLVGDNVVGVAQTAGQTTAETAQMPVKAAEDAPAAPAAK